MDAFKALLTRNIIGKKVLLFFVLATMVYVLMLVITIPRVMSFSKGMKLLDMMPTGYDLEYVNTLFNTLGQEGRDAYLNNQIPLDMIYPLLFGISFCLVLAYFLNKLNKLKSPFIYLCLLPIIAGTADYLENIGIIILLNSYPDLSFGMVTMTNGASLIKSSTTTLYFLILLISLIFLGIRVLKKDRKSI